MGVTLHALNNSGNAKALQVALVKPVAYLQCFQFNSLLVHRFWFLRQMTPFRQLRLLASRWIEPLCYAHSIALLPVNIPFYSSNSPLT